MRINNNLMAMNTHRQLGLSNAAGARSMGKLSSGYRINSAADDAAGLAISEKMRGQIRGLGQASRNAQDGISMIQTAEGALNETHAILQRMRELAVQSATDTNTTEDRAKIQAEVDQLSLEITRISTSTEFNSKKLLNGDMGKTFAVTANNFDSSLQNVRITGSDITTGTYTITATAAGTDTVTMQTNTAATGFVNSNISAADGTKFGNYTLNVTGLSGGTANFELQGPDGATTSVTGAAVGASLTIGGITFDFGDAARDVDSNGTIEFTLTNAGIDFDLSGAKTVAAAPITSYAGETINLGGIEFEARWGAATNGDALTLNVTDKAVKFHIGANADQNTELSINQMSASALGVDSLVVSTQAGANNSITTINDALEKVSEERAKLGAVQNRLDHTIKNLDTSAENLQASESRIRDVDMAKEMMEFTKNNILQQAAQAMLAQANQAPQGVLQLLR